MRNIFEFSEYKKNLVLQLISKYLKREKEKIFTLVSKDLDNNSNLLCPVSDTSMFSLSPSIETFEGYKSSVNFSLPLT